MKTITEKVNKELVASSNTASLPFARQGKQLWFRGGSVVQRVGDISTGVLFFGGMFVGLLPPEARFAGVDASLWLLVSWFSAGLAGTAGLIFGAKSHDVSVAYTASFTEKIEVILTNLGMVVNWPADNKWQKFFALVDKGELGDSVTIQISGNEQVAIRVGKKGALILEDVPGSMVFAKALKKKGNPSLEELQKALPVKLDVKKAKIPVVAKSEIKQNAATPEPLQVHPKVQEQVDLIESTLMSIQESNFSLSIHNEYAVEQAERETEEILVSYIQLTKVDTVTEEDVDSVAKTLKEKHATLEVIRVNVSTRIRKDLDMFAIYSDAKSLEKDF